MKSSNIYKFVRLTLAMSVAINSCFAQTEAPSNLGALSDDPAHEIRIDGKPIILIQAARNSLLRQEKKFSDVKWYYITPPALKKFGTSNSYVNIGPDLSDPSKVTLQLLIEPSNFDVNKLFVELKKIDPYVDSRERNLAPAYIYGFALSIFNSPEKDIPNQTPTPFVNPFSINLQLIKEVAENAKKAIDSGLHITVGYHTLVKNSQFNTLRIDWDAIKKTETFRKYDGPSGPAYITATQRAQIAYDVRSNLKGSYWNELGGSISADGNGFKDFFHNFLERFITKRDLIEVEMKAWADTQRLDVPINKFQGLVDEVRKIAYDSKNLKNDEWCRKYRDELKTTNERAQAREKGAGGSIGFNVIDLFSFNASGNESSTSSSSKEHYEKLLSSEDCGKKNFESNFTYAFDGVKYTPKSIRVFERNKASGNISDNTQISTYTTTNKIGRNTWSIGATSK